MVSTIVAGLEPTGTACRRNPSEGSSVRSVSSSEPGLSIGYLDHGDRLVVSVAGEVDLATAEELRLALERVVDSHVCIELDLRLTTFMDSSGLAALIDTHRRLLGDGASLVLRDPSPTILRLLEITGVTQFIQIRMDGARGSDGDEAD
jgi:anti-sigma B factor antagonist